MEVRKGDSETARRNKRESERGRECRVGAKKLYTADLSMAFTWDSALHNRQIQKWRRRMRERGRGM